MPGKRRAGADLALWDRALFPSRTKLIWSNSLELDDSAEYRSCHRVRDDGEQALRLLKPLARYLGIRGESGYIEPMHSTALTCGEARARLAAAEDRIRALGVARLAVFGSVARDRARPDSDVDVLVQFRPGQKSYARFLDLSELLESLLGRR